MRLCAFAFRPFNNTHSTPPPHKRSPRLNRALMRTLCIHLQSRLRKEIELALTATVSLVEGYTSSAVPAPPSPAAAASQPKSPLLRPLLPPLSMKRKAADDDSSRTASGQLDSPADGLVRGDSSGSSAVRVPVAAATTPPKVAAGSPPKPPEGVLLHKWVSGSWPSEAPGVGAAAAAAPRRRVYYATEAVVVQQGLRLAGTGAWSGGTAGAKLTVSLRQFVFSIGSSGGALSDNLSLKLALQDAHATLHAGDAPPLLAALTPGADDTGTAQRLVSRVGFHPEMLQGRPARAGSGDAGLLDPPTVDVSSGNYRGVALHRSVSAAPYSAAPRMRTASHPTKQPNRVKTDFAAAIGRGHRRQRASLGPASAAEGIYGGTVTGALRARPRMRSEGSPDDASGGAAEDEVVGGVSRAGGAAGAHSRRTRGRTLSSATDVASTEDHDRNSIAAGADARNPHSSGGSEGMFRSVTTSAALRVDDAFLQSVFRAHGSPGSAAPDAGELGVAMSVAASAPPHSLAAPPPRPLLRAASRLRVESDVLMPEAAEAPAEVAASVAFDASAAATLRLFAATAAKVRQRYEREFAPAAAADTGAAIAAIAGRPAVPAAQEWSGSDAMLLAMPAFPGAEAYGAILGACSTRGSGSGAGSGEEPGTRPGRDWLRPPPPPPPSFVEGSGGDGASSVFGGSSSSDAGFTHAAAARFAVSRGLGALSVRRIGLPPAAEIDAGGISAVDPSPPAYSYWHVAPAPPLLLRISASLVISNQAVPGAVAATSGPSPGDSRNESPAPLPPTVPSVLGTPASSRQGNEGGVGAGKDAPAAAASSPSDAAPVRQRDVALSINLDSPAILVVPAAYGAAVHLAAQYAAAARTFVSQSAAAWSKEAGAVDAEAAVGITTAATAIGMSTPRPGSAASNAAVTGAAALRDEVWTRLGAANGQLPRQQQPQQRGPRQASATPASLAPAQATASVSAASAARATRGTKTGGEDRKLASSPSGAGMTARSGGSAPASNVAAQLSRIWGTLQPVLTAQLVGARRQLRQAALTTSQWLVQVS
jgi:hypothetical protein